MQESIPAFLGVDRGNRHRVLRERIGKSGEEALREGPTTQKFVEKGTVNARVKVPLKERPYANREKKNWRDAE